MRHPRSVVQNYNYILFIFYNVKRHCKYTVTITMCGDCNIYNVIPLEARCGPEGG